MITWSCGGGLQSAAIAVLIREGAIAKPEFAGIAGQITWGNVMNWTKEDVERLEILEALVYQLQIDLGDAVDEEDGLADKLHEKEHEVKLLKEQLVSAKTELGNQRLLFDTLPDSAKRHLIMNSHEGE